MKIIYAEDDDATRIITEEVLLSIYGKGSVVTVKSGEALLEKAKDAYYDIILTDNQMRPGGLTGIDVVKQLRNLGITIRIVVYSADNVKDAALKAGANEFFLKSGFAKRLVNNNGL